MIRQPFFNFKIAKMAAKFVYVSQHCAVFVVRHANARTTGIR
jgi:hypothetical protein